LHFRRRDSLRQLSFFASLPITPDGFRHLRRQSAAAFSRLIVWLQISDFQIFFSFDIFR
jgi:hypothetical protein